jgi:hypothetical protein
MEKVYKIAKKNHSYSLESDLCDIQKEKKYHLIDYISRNNLESEH